jgi:putative DNA primase/helicase
MPHGLAALFHVFEQGLETAVDFESFENASRIAVWHLHEARQARRFFGELALPVELANAVRLDNWLLDTCKRQRTGSVPRRELQRLGPIRGKNH